MKLKPAIVQILRGAGTALHVEEIAARCIASGLWKTTGKTPHATVGARIYSDIKKNKDQSPFVQVDKQTFALRDCTVEPKADSLSAKKAPSPPAASTSLSFLNCAQKVLEQHDKKEPMHYKEITDIALRKGWLVTVGKTPEATMYAQVITEISRQQKRGERPRFTRHGRGYVGLSQWVSSGLTTRIEQHNKQVRKDLHKFLLAMKPDKFEKLISRLLVEMGFDVVEVTKLSRDGGVDVRGTLIVGDAVRIRMAVQVKRWKSNVPAPVVQQVRGSLVTHERGLIITTSNFSVGAKKEAEQPSKDPIALMNGEQLVALLLEHRIGVRSSTTDLFEIDEDSLELEV